MKILIVSNEKQWEVKQIKKEAVKRNHKAVMVSPKNLSSKFLNKKVDAVIVRAIRGNGELVRKNLQKLHSSSVKLLDESLLKEKPRNKYSNFLLFKKNKLFQPKTFLFSKKRINFFEKQFNEFAVIKNVSGKRGEEVFKVNVNDLRKFSKTLSKRKKYLIQEFVPIKKELRVLVLGKKVLGVYEKKSFNWKKNIALGAEAKKFTLTNELKKLSLRAALIVRRDFLGLDLALTPSGYFVLEANRSPQFKGFQKLYPKINVAKELILFLEKLKV